MGWGVIGVGCERKTSQEVVLCGGVGGGSGVCRGVGGVSQPLVLWGIRGGRGVSGVWWMGWEGG